MVQIGKEGLSSVTADHSFSSAAWQQDKITHQFSLSFRKRNSFDDMYVCLFKCDTSSEEVIAAKTESILNMIEMRPFLAWVHCWGCSQVCFFLAAVIWGCCGGLCVPHKKAPTYQHPWSIQRLENLSASLLFYALNIQKDVTFHFTINLKRYPNFCAGCFW